MRVKFKNPDYVDKIQERIQEYSSGFSPFSTEEIKILKSSNIMIEVEKVSSFKTVERARLINFRNGTLSFPLKYFEILPYTELHSKYIDKIKNLIIHTSENHL